MTPQQVKEIFIQLLFYAGIPATVHGLLQAQAVINQREEWKAADIPLETGWLETIEDKLQRAHEFREREWGERANQEIEGSLAQRLVPDASDIVDGYNYGEVWVRKELSPRERMVCVLAALTSRGHWSQLKRYVRYALQMGSPKPKFARCLPRPVGTGAGPMSKTPWKLPKTFPGIRRLNPPPYRQESWTMTTVAELQEKSAELRAFFDQHLPYARPTPVLADFIRVQHELMWGRVWLVDGLDLKLRSFATITAQCVNGYDFGVEHQVRTGLTVGITAQQIKASSSNSCSMPAYPPPFSASASPRK